MALWDTLPDGFPSASKIVSPSPKSSLEELRELRSLVPSSDELREMVISDSRNR